MIVIDTDVLIEIIEKRSEKGQQAFTDIKQSGEDVAITAITFHETFYGLLKFGKKKMKYLDSLETIPFDQKDAGLAAQLELQAEKQGRPLSRTDAMIAAITINNNAKLFTFNRKHFSKIPSLTLFPD